MTVGLHSPSFIAYLNVNGTFIKQIYLYKELENTFTFSFMLAL